MSAEGRKAVSRKPRGAVAVTTRERAIAELERVLALGLAERHGGRWRPAGRPSPGPPVLQQRPKDAPQSADASSIMSSEDH